MSTRGLDPNAWRQPARLYNAHPGLWVALICVVMLAVGVVW